MKKESKIYRMIINFVYILYKYMGLIFFIMFLIPILIFILDIITLEKTSKEAVADGFNILDYTVFLDVKEDNKIDVVENITVQWYEDFHHGIYKFTPLWLQYTDRTGNTIKRKATISNYQAVGEPYSLDMVNKKARIKIGDANKFVEKGAKNYIIKYTYDMGKDPYKDFDELIFHAYGDYWGTEIKNARLIVNMPKDIEGYKVNFFTDKFRKENVTDIVDYEVKKNTLIAIFNESKNYQKQKEEYCRDTLNKNEDGTCNEEYFYLEYKPLKKSLTVDIELPEGYFTSGSWNYGWISFIISMLVFLLTSWTIYKWMRFGKNYPKQAETVEFYPPDDLSAAEVGYVFHKRQTSKKYTIALLIQLASKGYIKIDDLHDKDKNIQITNLCIKPKQVKKFDSALDPRQIEVKKLKDIDDTLNISETTMMVHLFKNGDNKVITTNIDRFLKVKDSLVKRGFIKIISDNFESRIIKRDERKKLYEKEITKYNKDMEIYKEKLSKMPPMKKLEKLVYDRLFESDDIVILSEHKTFYKAFDDVSLELNTHFKDKIHDKEATKQLIITMIINIVELVLCILSYFYFEDLDPAWSILYYLSFICIIINLFFTLIMKRKTSYGEVITAKVKGFRNFLTTVEKEKLETLVADNPNYFYNLLPYTYVLNISKKWIKKFENIYFPEIDMGNFNYSSDYSYHNLYDNVYHPIPDFTAISSGGSSGGGGCSSCGGGCSSCGGGGSW